MNIIDAIVSRQASRFIDMASGSEILSLLKIERVALRFSSEPMRHPLEDGSTEIDTRVIRPIVMMAEVICPSAESLNQLNAIILDRSTLIEIRTRGLIVRNMKISNGLAIQNKQMLSATPFRIEFKQLLIENVDPVIFKAASDSSLIDRGIAAARDLVDDARELAGNAIDTASELAGQVRDRLDII